MRTQIIMFGLFLIGCMPTTGGSRRRSMPMVALTILLVAPHVSMEMMNTTGTLDMDEASRDAGSNEASPTNTIGDSPSTPSPASGGMQTEGAGDTEAVDGDPAPLNETSMVNDEVDCSMPTCIDGECDTSTTADACLEICIETCRQQGSIPATEHVRSAFGGHCEHDSECESGMCQPSPLNIQKYCVAACDEASDCPDNAVSCLWNLCIPEGFDSPAPRESNPANLPIDTCHGLGDCLNGCGADRLCTQRCKDRSSPLHRTQFIEHWLCALRHACTDMECLQMHCRCEHDVCAGATTTSAMPRTTPSV